MALTYLKKMAANQNLKMVELAKEILEYLLGGGLQLLQNNSQVN